MSAPEPAPGKYEYASWLVDIILKYAYKRTGLGVFLLNDDVFSRLLTSTVQLLLDDHVDNLVKYRLWTMWLAVLVQLPHIPGSSDKLCEALEKCPFAVEDVMRDAKSTQLVCIAEHLELRRMKPTVGDSSSSSLEMLRDQIRTHGHELVGDVLNCLQHSTNYVALVHDVIQSEIVPAIHDNCDGEVQCLAMLKCLVCNCMAVLLKPDPEACRDDMTQLFGQIDIKAMDKTELGGTVDALFRVTAGVISPDIDCTGRADDDKAGSALSGASTGEAPPAAAPDVLPESPGPDSSQPHGSGELPGPIVPPASGAGTDEA